MLRYFRLSLCQQAFVRAGQMYTCCLYTSVKFAQKQGCFKFIDVKLQLSKLRCHELNAVCRRILAIDTFVQSVKVGFHTRTYEDE